MVGLQLLSGLLGWSYFLCWSISLYPPILLNRQLKSVEGTSFDFAYMNAIGYLTYAISLSLLFLNQRVRNEYAQRHSLTGSGELNFPLVRFNDVCYGVHGTILVWYALYQIYFCGYKQHANQRVSKFVKYLLSCSSITAMVLSTYILYIPDHDHYQLLDVAIILGNVKVVLSMSKYIPQVVYNYKRKSTKGWSMDAVLLDLIGGILSLMQLFLDGYLRNDLKGVFNNSVKLALAGITLIFDVIFIFQHYLLYPPKQLDNYEPIGLNELEA